MTRSQTDISQGENELLFSKRAEKKAPKFLKPQGHFLKDFPVSDILDISMTEEKIRKYAYTKEEVDRMIDHAVRVAVAEAQRIDEESMKKHNRDATVISMILGFTALALFVDGLLRLLGIIPPFMEIDIDILDRIVERVETDVIDKVRQVPIQKIWPR
tara:strand:- start:311 stop:784 length:474 start_codon:yes stop_codon:yes gene_type:complete